MDVKIRPARADERKVLAGIEAECFPEAEAASEAVIGERMEAFLEQFFVAELGGKAVGFVNGCVTEEAKLPDILYHDVSFHRPAGAYFTVFGLNVLPEYRRRGIAEALMRRYIGEARRRGKKGVILTCKDKLIPYYEKLGFVCYGVADSSHGGAIWNDMRLLF